MSKRDLILSISPREIANYVESCVGDTKAVVRHPLGFIRIPLFREARPSQGDLLCGELARPDLNLHIWPSGLKLNDGNDVHYHVFQMRSRILHGCLTDILYADEESNQENEKALWRYRVHYQDGQQDHVMCDTGVRVELSEFETRVLSPGDSYYVPRGVYHRTILGSERFTLTLIDRWGHDASLPCHVLCQPGSPERIIYRPELLPWEDTWTVIREALQILRVTP